MDKIPLSTDIINNNRRNFFLKTYNSFVQKLHTMQIRNKIVFWAEISEELCKSHFYAGVKEQSLSADGNNFRVVTTPVEYHVNNGGQMVNYFHGTMAHS